MNIIIIIIILSKMWNYE